MKNQLVISPTLLDLPLVIQEQIYKHLNLQTLLELRGTCRHFRDHIDAVVADQEYTTEQLRCSKQLMRQAFKYFAYIEAHYDPFYDILEQSHTQQMSSNELSSRIQIKMRELENLVTQHISRTIQEPHPSHHRALHDSKMQLIRITANMNKMLMIMGCVLAALSFLLPGILKLFKSIQQGDIVTCIFTLSCLAYLSYFIYDFCFRRYQDFTQENIKFHKLILTLAHNNLRDMEESRNDNISKRDPHARMDYLWANSKKFLKLGIEQLEKKPGGTQILLPESLINVHTLKMKWGQA